MQVGHPRQGDERSSTPLLWGRSPARRSRYLSTCMVFESSTRRNLQHRRRPAAPRDPPRPHHPPRHHPALAAQEHHLQREAHPERVYRGAARDQQPGAGPAAWQQGQPEQPGASGQRNRHPTAGHACGREVPQAARRRELHDSLMRRRGRLSPPALQTRGLPAADLRPLAVRGAPFALLPAFPANRLSFGDRPCRPVP